MSERMNVVRVAACIPAALALVIAVGTALVLILVRPDRNALVSRYHVDADRALAAGDTTTARLCAQRLMQLDPGDPLNRERLSLANAMGR